MFVIPCKYNPEADFVTPLVEQIRFFHSSEPIVVVDSASENKSYFNKLKELGVIVEDVNNKNWMVGAYWHAFKKYPDEEFYYFLHDSMKVKANLDYLKKDDVTLVATFSREASPSFNAWNKRIEEETSVNKSFIKRGGRGCYGPIIMCKNKVFKSFQNKKIDLLLPNNKGETGILEGAYGLFLEADGYDLNTCSLYGDILQLESPGGKSGVYPHNTSWQHPIEKFYASHITVGRRWND